MRHKALVIAYGVHESGRREVIGVDVGEAETDSFWRQSLRSLRAGGLDGVKLCSSDAHVGLKHAIALVLGCPWQRCTVHFLRDLLGHVSRAQQPLVSGAIGGIFTATSAGEARARLGQVVDQLPIPFVIGLLPFAALIVAAVADAAWGPPWRSRAGKARTWLVADRVALSLDPPKHRDLDGISAGQRAI